MADYILGVDTATKLTAKNCADLAAAGYKFVGRYLVPNAGATAWKALTKEEAERICNAGLSILCVWETTAERAKQGYAAGCTDGAKALELAREIGMAEDGIIYFAVDYDAQRADFQSIREYLRGAGQNSGPYAIGVYGGYNLIEYMAKYGACRGFWQTLAWSYGKLSAIIADMQTPDDDTFVMPLSQPYYGVFNDLTMCLPLGIVQSEAFERGAANAYTFCADKTAGTGAYMLDSVFGNVYSFVLNPYFWGEKPDVETFDIKVIDDNDAKPLFEHFRTVIEWVKKTFPVYRKQMKTVDWGKLYELYGRGSYDSEALEEEVSALMKDKDEVGKLDGIYEYVFDHDKRHLNLRKFSDYQKSVMYERQKGICPMCKGTKNENKKWDFSEMDGDHVVPWSKGGKTTLENGQMLCREHNLQKSDF